jgi:photosystem II stability/assembly factor-like uncharacterized protein
VSFRDDVRRHFERAAALQPVPMGLRTSVTADAARSVKSDQPRTLRWAAAVAGVLAVAIVAGLLASGELRRVITTPVVPGTPRPVLPRVLPPGNVVDASLYESDSGWVLLDRCSAGMCTYYVSTSHARGPWTGPVQVGPSYPVDHAAAPRHVHVVSPDGMDGFVYGGGEAFVTHDGGQTWQDVKLLGGVLSITGQGTAWMVTYYISCDYDTTCARVQISRDGGRTWSLTSQLPAFVPVNVVAFAKGGLMMSNDAGDILMTQDGGQTWTRLKGNCTPDSVANRIATGDGNQIWQTCTGTQPNPAERTLPWSSALFVSNDGGQSWAGDGSVLAGTFQMLWSPVHDGLVVATNTAGLMVTKDGGQSWTQIETNPQFFAMVSLSDLAEGSAWAVDSVGAIWATADAGRTWVRLAVGSSASG